MKVGSLSIILASSGTALLIAYSQAQCNIGIWLAILGITFIAISIPIIFADLKNNKQQSLRDLIKYNQEVNFTSSPEQEEKLKKLENMCVIQWIVSYFRR